MFTLPAVFWKGEAPWESNLKRVIALCFKWKLSVENSRQSFSYALNRSSFGCLDNSTNHLGLNTFQLRCILTIIQTSLTSLGKTYTLGYYLTTYLLKWVPENESSLEPADELSHRVSIVTHLESEGKGEQEARITFRRHFLLFSESPV